MASGNPLTQSEAARKKRTKVAAAIIFTAAPIVLVISCFLNNSRWHMLLSVLMLGVVIIPFFLVFERRKPKAREIVLIAVLSAITVVVHVFFHIILPLQIGTAMVIISGVSLGPEAGFLIGALSRFVCNFFLGQGLWTPWQMFCWGLLGFLAGLAFNRGNVEKVNSDHFKAVLGPVMTVIFAELIAYISFVVFPGPDESFFSWRIYAFGAVGLIVGVLIQRKRLPIDAATLVLFTFFTSFILYGGIMNFASMVTTMTITEVEVFSSNTLRLMYISGLPYDILHAVTASICILFLGKPMIRKLERIKTKFGLTGEEKRYVMPESEAAG